MTNKQVGKERVPDTYTSITMIILESNQEGTQTRQKPGGRSYAGPCRGAAYWVSSHVLLCLLPYRTQDL